MNGNRVKIGVTKKMVLHVPIADRGNLLSYIDDVRTAARKEVREKIGRAKIRYIRNSGGKNYNKENLNILEATSKPLSIVVKKRRYDDLFEDFMEYLDEDKLYEPNTLKDELKDLFDKNPRMDEFRRKNQKGYDGMVDSLSEKFLRTGKAQEFFDEKSVERLSPERKTVYISKVNKKQQPRWHDLVAQKRAYKIFNPKIKELQLIYQDKQDKYRDINSGRFAPRPSNLRKELMKEFK